jgi:hypothetical protein
MGDFKTRQQPAQSMADFAPVTLSTAQINHYGSGWQSF